MTPTDEVDHVDLDGDTQDLEDIHVIDDISPTSTNGQKRRNRASNSSVFFLQRKEVLSKMLLLIRLLEWLYHLKSLSVLILRTLIQQRYMLKYKQYQVLVKMNNSKHVLS
ncbi:uncharacterized protein Pyn_12597 [Prunus yedoensis var. nudiflora]|uniref:Uncharacterized protein n=1 Tax=Prunus yedoensis var. nudiflora TaxID=2094558 RepID=A0A314YRW9_PRUYE|nr:uncharacterized protein Pyn_12597 [Prunus yedoensis var. nudiflora]